MTCQEPDLKVNVRKRRSGYIAVGQCYTVIKLLDKDIVTLASRPFDAIMRRNATSA